MNVTQGDQDRVLSATEKLLFPIVRALMRFGVSYGDVSNILKTLFVRAAAEDFGVRGRPTNNSRIAAITGLSRKEISRIKPLLDRREVDEYRKVVSPSRVMSEWKSNPRFLDNDGKPKVLPYDDLCPSFVELVRAAGTDVTPGAIRDELLRVGCIAQIEGGDLLLERSIYYDGKSSANRLCSAFSNSLRLHAETVLFNVTHNREEGAKAERIVYSDRIRSQDCLGFRGLATAKLVDLAETFSSSVDSYEFIQANNTSEKQSATHVQGIGLYYFDDLQGTN